MEISSIKKIIKIVNLNCISKKILFVTIFYNQLFLNVSDVYFLPVY